MKLAELSLEKFAHDLAGVSPTPGGGSAAALAGSLGASLCAMVARLTVGREKYKNAWEKMERVRGEGDRLAAELMALVDRDTDAYNQVTAAFKMPKTTDQEKAARSRAVQEATREAALAPLETLKAAAELPGLARDALEWGNPNCVTDIGVAGQMIRAAAFGAAYNVRINISGLKDRDLVRDLEKQTLTLLDQTVEALADIEKRVDEELKTG